MSGDAEVPNANWAVAIVHGIGKTEPVEMIREVTGAIKSVRPDLKLEEHTRAYESRQPTPPDGGLIERGRRAIANARGKAPDEAPAGSADWKLQHVRRGRIGNTDVRFATAYWSDVSLIGESLVALIGSLALGGLGVRYFADVSTFSKTPVTRLLHWVLMVMILLLAIGFLPLVVSSLLTSATALFGYHLFQATEFSKEPFQWQIPFIAVGSLVAGGFVAWFGISQLWGMRKQRRLMVPLFLAILGFSLVISLLLLLDHPRGLGSLSLKGSVINGQVVAHDVIRPVFDWWSDASGDRHWRQRVVLLDETSVYLMLLQFGQYLCGFAVIALAAVSLVLLSINWLWLFLKSMVRKPRWERHRSASIGAISVTVMWALILFVMWPENLLTSYVIIHFFNIKMHPVWPADLENYLFRLADMRIVRAPTNTIEQLQQLHPLPWFDLVYFGFLFGVVVIVAVLFIWRIVWGSLQKKGLLKSFTEYRPRADGSPGATCPMPRLLLSWACQAAVLMFMLAISVVALAHLLKKDAWIAKQLFAVEDYIPHEISLYSTNVMAGVGIASLVFLFIAHRIRDAVKLGLDVVNHFATPKLGFPIRKQIASRLHDTLTFLLENKDKSEIGASPGKQNDIGVADASTHLVIICHSQGTVITFDTLFGHMDRDGKWHAGLWETGLRERVASLTLLTFGSPLTHIYQHYFASLYPRFSELEELDASQAPEEEGQSGKVTVLRHASQDPKLKWINSYRIDDYVGTYIDPLQAFPINLPMPIGGHTRYWERDVFEILFSNHNMSNVLVDLGAPQKRS